MQQLKILKEIKESKAFKVSDFKIQIARTQSTYEIYKANPIYINANRIYKANRYLYKLTESLIFDVPNLAEEIVKLIWHLDDWILLYEKKVSKDKPNINDVFIFDTNDNYMRYPKEIIDKILNL